MWTTRIPTATCYALVLLSAVLPAFAQAKQSIGELYHKQQYQAVVELAEQQQPASAEEWYYVGYSYFQLSDDIRAIAAYDRAIEAGGDESSIYFFKGLALRYSERFNEAIAAFDEAIARDPRNQSYISEKAFTYYTADNLDSALALFLTAKRLPIISQMPWYMIPHIYHTRQQFDIALTEFYTALGHISPDNQYYVPTLMDIGLLEFTFTRNYEKSALAYQHALEHAPDNYTIHPKLMKAYHANKQYALADSVFRLVKTAYEQGLLPEEYNKFKTVPIAEFHWNGRTGSVYKSLVIPEIPKPLYKIYLANPEDTKIERTLLVERTFSIQDTTATYLLCESAEGGVHRTYPYGWQGDDIPFESLIEKVLLVLEGKKPAASSRPGK